MAVFANTFLSRDTTYCEFSRVINKIQCNNGLVHLDKKSVNKDNPLRIAE